MKDIDADNIRRLDGGLLLVFRGLLRRRRTTLVGRDLGLSQSAVSHALTRLRDLVREHRVRRIVIGLPLHLDGTPSEMSEEARGFATRVRKALGLPVELMDERLSSWEAKQVVASATSPRNSRGGGHPARNARMPLDEVAAAIILRDYLERSRAQTGPQD